MLLDGNVVTLSSDSKEIEKELIVPCIFCKEENSHNSIQEIIPTRCR